MSENDSQENKKPKRIDSTTRYLLIGTAIIFDLISIIPVVGQFLAIGGAGITFYIWFKTLGVSFISPKRIVTTAVEYIGEAIPVVSALPLITTGTIIMIVLTDIEDKTGIGLASLAAGKMSKGKVSTTAQRTERKAARRAADPERATRARERLAKMKEKKVGIATKTNPQGMMRDLKPTEKYNYGDGGAKVTFKNPWQKLKFRVGKPQIKATGGEEWEQNPASERLRLIRGGGQGISAPSQPLSKYNEPLTDHSPPTGPVENKEKGTA
ncbi:MAG: hypothetical protein NUW02_01090 [Candidatus Campbellbacteria bacterium]|nr:hypothetical protein [Candidatus Campbellbacteria bacterium]